MKIIATPIILENYENWVILNKAKLIDFLLDQHWPRTPENPYNVRDVLDSWKENEYILLETERHIILDKGFYDISKLDRM